MPAYIRLDDVSPVISYDAGWAVGSTQDPNWVYYSDGGTFHSTPTTNAKATIVFRGTGVALFGAKRFNHGSYSVTLDGATSSFNSPTGPEVYEALLFEQQGLPDGLHTVELVNTATTEGRSWLDLDVVQLSTVVPEHERAVSHDEFKYDPREVWSTDSTLLDRKYNGTVHVSRQAGSTATLIFSGSAVDLYGAICPECAKFSVLLDGILQTPTPLPSSADQWVRNSTLFWMARGLDEREHTLVVKSEESRLLAIEGAVVYSSKTQSVAGGRTKVPIAAIVGGVLGGLIFILAVFTALLLWRRRQKRSRQIFDLDSSRNQSSLSSSRPGPWDGTAMRTAAISLPASSPPATVMSGAQTSTSAYLDPLSPLSTSRPGPVVQAASAQRTKQHMIFGVGDSKARASRSHSGEVSEEMERLPGYGDVVRGA